jgi:hypothetical protein
MISVLAALAFLFAAAFLTTGILYARARTYTAQALVINLSF